MRFNKFNKGEIFDLVMVESNPAIAQPIDANLAPISHLTNYK